MVAVALVGSHARGEAHPGSDVDLVLLTMQPSELLGNQAWVGRFGRVVRLQAEDWGRVQSIRVWYESGDEVEFGISNPTWATAPDDGTRTVVRDGLRALWDPEGILARL